MDQVISRAIALYEKHFGSEPQALAMAPGRVNLIGEHTDYNGGLALPAAIDRYVVVALGKADGETSAFSEQQGMAELFEVAELKPGSVGGWGKYPAGVAWSLKQRGIDLPDVNAAVAASLFSGAGLASSAALECAFALAWSKLAGAELSQSDVIEVGHQAENEFIDLPTGKLDQTACMMGKEGNAMLLDFASNDLDYVPIPDGCSIAVLDTRIQHDLVDSGYSDRGDECRQACEKLGVKSLREVSMSDLIGHRNDLSEVLYRRVRHVVSENIRVRRVVEAFVDSDYVNIGRALEESHRSLKNDFEVSCDALDAMAHAAHGAPGYRGARMTGAGFGGACVAIVESLSVEAFLASTKENYMGTGDFPEPRLLICQATDGATLYEGQS